ncbi:heterokaryon incompatibility protein-domain-containing protein [Clohesyomyces aquaticus]|uniref:Heterokaryon incompatibility protein-domain-containing protein n=1 Tax=Clohesyomyces aquaticus TaxID=1231657 RepID=A0A1Y1YZG0_9PLEO|nr:heterokaryon incompatibility protein-domain-containing protein [Clohesyomyces aquaticus]
MVLPNRVLELDGSPDHGIRVRLFESNGKHVRYVCLSYCWGLTGCALKTASQNLDAHKNGIPFSHLSRTFQDAVVFTQWLGIRYLWIDALCIIQDSKRDRELESSRMASIYEHSYLTLSAAKAFQERIISPRTLHFGDSELFWECRSVTRCECNLKGTAKRRTKGWFASSLPEPRKVSYESETAELVYSEHHLTFATHRLPAIFGLAKNMSNGIPLGRYMAGNWEHDKAALLWHVRGEPE